MKICYICHSLDPQTGIGRLVTSIMDGEQRARPDLETSTMTSADLLPMNNKIKFLLNFRRVIKEVKKADLIHVFDAFPYGLIAIVAGWFARRPVVLTAIGTGSVKKLGQWPHSFLLRLTFLSCAKVTAISHYVKNKIQAKIPHLDIQVICPGLDYSFWGNQSDHSGKNPISIENYILSVGTFKRRKGYDVSLRVFKTLLSQFPDLRYVIVGQPDERNSYFREIGKLIKQNGLSDYIIILSDLTKEALRSVYHDTRLFILLSRDDGQDIEGFGQVFLEAAAAGVPVLGGRGSGADDAILDGVNGYLLDPANEKEIAIRAAEILTDEELRSKLSCEGVAFAQKMDWSNKIPEYLKLYEKIQS